MAEDKVKKSKEKGGEEEPKRAQRATSNVFAMFPQHQIQEFKEAFTMIDQNRDGFIDVEDLKDMYASLGREPTKAELQEMLKEAPGQLNFTAFLTLFGEKTHGRDPSRSDLEEMLKEVHGQLNFTAFLTTFGEKLHGRTPSTQDCEEMLKECVHGQMNFTAFLTLFGQKLHGTDPEGTIMDAFKMFDGENVGYLEEEYFKDLLMNVGDQYNQSEINQTWKELPLEGGRIDYVKFTKILKGSNTEDVA